MSARPQPKRPNCARDKQANRVFRLLQGDLVYLAAPSAARKVLEASVVDGIRADPMYATAYSNSLTAGEVRKRGLVKTVVAGVIARWAANNVAGVQAGAGLESVGGGSGSQGIGGGVAVFGSGVVNGAGNRAGVGIGDGVGVGDGYESGSGDDAVSESESGDGPRPPQHPLSRGTNTRPLTNHAPKKAIDGGNTGRGLPAAGAPGGQVNDHLPQSLWWPPRPKTPSRRRRRRHSFSSCLLSSCFSSTRANPLRSVAKPVYTYNKLAKQQTIAGF
ncbi:hypothetical protein DL95DRAFT_452707 [Leptodontidium sp. 2 PMI_412]|nr:hypothetical protein DL95DRAFT_452707 [Leptodontidium sp. 2 PMI_412]